MAFSISAELPLGTYRGHASDGAPERIPSVARLHAALLCAAGFGPRAQLHGDDLAPCDADEAALRWLEEHPPDGVAIPALRVNSGTATAYRNDGTLKRSGGVGTVKKLGKDAGSSVALDGPLTWSWSETPPPEIAAALEALCPEVPYLGTTESPVRLRANTAEPAPTHTLDPAAGIFSSGGEDVHLPARGRTAELSAAHTATRTAPTARADKPKTDEKSGSPVPPRTAVRPARYTRVAADTGHAPWPDVLLVPLDRAIVERDRVRFAVAAHRALIRAIDEGAPGVLTGAYPEGASRPPNRVALQILAAEHPIDLPNAAPAALAVMLPRDVAAGDLAAVLGAVRSLRALRAPYREPVAVTGHAELRAGATFWPEPPAGTVRLWRTSPAAVPDTRGSGQDWTFAHAALLALGFVWQASPHLPRVPGRGSARYRGLVAAVNDAGAAAITVEPLRTSAVGDYVHRVHPDACGAALPGHPRPGRSRGTAAASGDRAEPSSRRGPARPGRPARGQHDARAAAVTLRRSDFAAFFAALHDGNRPFAWQERLLDAVLEDGRWPENVAAPTGSGKTAVIDVHVFATALAADGHRPVPPRRLALVVDRRVLVDDQLRYARALARRLADPAGGGNDVVAAVSDRLRPLRWPDPQLIPGAGVSPLIVARMRGGAPPSREWREHPTAAAVICATPDMWGSRLLLRGYGSPARAWPREAGLLAIDSVVVVDEAHLAQQLLCTARRIAELVPVAERNVAPRALQVVATTATPPDAATTRAIGVELDDLEDDVLGRRLTRPKPVRLQPVKGWAKSAAAGTAALAEAVMELVDSVESVEDAARTIGCFVNTVARAVGVAEELRRRTVDGRRLRVVMVCGQARPIDVELLEVHHPWLLTPRGNNAVDVLVSTQSLEVGVDLDLAGMVTELAGGPALAQRAGRVNRRGLRHEGPVIVTVPEDDEFSERLRSGPYNAEDLDAAMTWLRKRAIDSVGLAPWALRDAPPPMLESRRILLQRPELGDAWHWARTSDELAAEPELELWLSDDFAADTCIGMVVRNLPADADDALQLLRALPPRRHEVFSIPTATAREALQAVPQDHLRPVLRVRGDDVTVLERQTGDGGAPPIRPGDVLVFDTSLPLFTRSDAAFSPPVLAPPGAERIPGGLAGADDVLEAQADLPEPVWAERRVGAVVRRVELDADAPHTNLLDPDEEPLDGDALRAAVLAVLGTGPMATAAAELLTGPARHSDVVVHCDAEGRAVRALVIDRRRASVDEDMRQVWPPAAGAVTLAVHQHDVAQRAALLARALGLDDDIVEVLHAAGAHHDDGKADARFQRRLGTRAEPALAKSRAGTTPEQMRRNEAASGLPSGWRHEQLSVLAAWEPLAATPDRELAARLVGTSHGLGRSGFPHTATELTPDAPDVAQWLFDHGGWDELIETTHHRYGVWGCAYLEAVLRAADGQISAEGR